MLKKLSLSLLRDAFDETSDEREGQLPERIIDRYSRNSWIYLKMSILVYEMLNFLITCYVPLVRNPEYKCS